MTRLHSLTGMGLFALLLLSLTPGHAEGQLAWRDFVVTSGVSLEGYRGNLPTVAAVRDSAEVANAVVGEVATRGEFLYRPNGAGTFLVSFDGAMRQFSAWGFQSRDYAPREWVGSAEGTYLRPLGDRTMLAARSRLRGREVEDRPPMPIFLQPGYVSFEGGLGVDYQWNEKLRLDVEGTWEQADFAARTDAPQVRLLDRAALGVEGGATAFVGDASTVRLYASAERSRYPEQSTFLPDDPFREDRTFQGGGSWTYNGGFVAQVGVDGRINRSNSPRPEYNAVTGRLLLTASLPAGVTGSAFAAISVKEYLTASEFARLIPGEEANNTSSAYLSFSRLLALNLNGTVRLSWTRAETEIGEAYFQRGGLSILLNYRPGF